MTSDESSQIIAEIEGILHVLDYESISEVVRESLSERVRELRRRLSEQVVMGSVRRTYDREEDPKEGDRAGH